MSKFLTELFPYLFVLLILILTGDISYKKKKLNPIEQPVKGIISKTGKRTRKVYYQQRYIQYQFKKNGKWILHNTEGPAVIDEVKNKKYFFIEGIKYEDEFQYLVAKGDYENV